MRGAEWVGMDDQLIDELRMLRARAYGPDPDIHDDPSAMSRLQDLEQLARGPEVERLPAKPPLPTTPVAPRVATPLPDLPEDQGRPEPIASAAPVGEDVADANADENRPEVPARRGTWTKKRIAVTWLASLAVAVLVTATVTGFVSRRIQADPREIAVLGVDPYAVWPGIFAAYAEDGEQQPGVPEGGVAYQAFHGLSFFRMSNGMYAFGTDETCLLVVESAKINDDNNNSFEGFILNGCEAGAFPATVEIVVTPGPQRLPEELVEAFPEGTALQFVLEGDEVVVLSDRG